MEGGSAIRSMSLLLFFHTLYMYRSIMVALIISHVIRRNLLDDDVSVMGYSCIYKHDKSCIATVKTHPFPFQWPFYIEQFLFKVPQNIIILKKWNF